MRTGVVLIIFSVFFGNTLVYSQDGLPDSLLNKLNAEIKKSSSYDAVKDSGIFNLKEKLKVAQDSDARFAIINNLFDEYTHYNFDSALHYSLLLQAESLVKNNHTRIVSAKLKTILTLLSGSMFKETFDSLNVISIADVTDSVKAEYYILKGIAYYLLAEYNNFRDPISSSYASITNSCFDSALTFLPVKSFNHIYYSSIRLLRNGQLDSAFSILNQLCSRTDLTHVQTALAANAIAGIWRLKGKNEQNELTYLVYAAIADIRSSTKDNTSLHNLAEIVYKKGSIEVAVEYIRKAYKDASFYDTRLRQVQIGTILPHIEGDMMDTIKSQKEKLKVFLILISVLAVFLAALVVIIWKQVKKLRGAKQNISEANEKQKSINEELRDANTLKEKYNSELEATNSNLQEANRIKEEYIGYFFNVNSEFFDKIERFKKSIDQKITDRKIDEIRFLVNNINLKREKEELIKQFDRAFLKLFPNFVSEFNELFKEEDRLLLRDDELLNTDLRIFALFRMGIQENEKIASILQYSVNTINTYKTKIKNKSILPNEDFEHSIMKIRTIK
ncbi:MAG: DUF6377 domain-containing protein [Bacteroidota bacterium]